MKRAALVDALLASASAQTTLGGFSSGGPRKPYGRDAKSVRLKQMCLSFTPVKGKVQTEVLRGHTLKILSRLPVRLRYDMGLPLFTHREMH